MLYLIYKITNLINGKIYIGKHKTLNENDSYMGSGRLIIAAINKYGIENFKKEILYRFDNEEEMNNMEALIVNETFIKRKDTYNIDKGGKGGDFSTALKRFKELYQDPQWRKDFREKLGKCAKDPERCKKASISLKKYYETHEGTFKGKHHNEETKKKMRDKARRNNHQKGSKNSMYGRIWIINTITEEIKSIKKEDFEQYEKIGFIRGKTLNQKYREKHDSKGHYIKEPEEIKKKNTKLRQLKRKETLKQKGKLNCYINKETKERKYFTEKDEIDLSIWEPTWSKFNLEEIEKFLERGQTWEQITEYYNTTYWSIYSWYRQYKKPRKQREKCICPVCGKEYNKFPIRKYCSKECYRKARYNK